MEPRMYVCEYCKKEYLPKRRRVQKFCSDSCRVRKHQLKSSKISKELSLKENIVQKEKTKIEAVSFAGVGNAALGNLAVKTLSTLFTKEENKPATKGDILKLTKLIRYQEIRNLSKDLLGKKPFFDTVLKIVVYK
ncbi:hypothetical protein H9W90_10540 [Polaribacter pectinis]|uniref:Uncharacterized protein n=1 Tax=Polaribacter pectinis TaxID=2738844 RepID=A0A7G9L7N5_9FLAO|nr:hypothetical protein [Polaribacter pectinis]QNM84548.1 hypothetical protein H9W90_10100 [Polaribacter pectinis]QNM84634.1 hypothetical protein H9W90_10540 [Polaribacter pectinis]